MSENVVKTEAPKKSGTPLFKFRYHSILTLTITLILGTGLAVATTWPLRANILVLSMGGLTFIFCVISLYQETRPRAGKLKSSGMDIELSEHQELGKNASSAMDIWAWLVGSVVGIWLMGFFWAVPIWSFLYALIHGSRWYVALLIAGICFIFLWGVFEQLIHIPWPEPWIQQFLPWAQ